MRDRTRGEKVAPNMFEQDGRYRYRFDVPPDLSPWFPRATVNGTLDTRPSEDDGEALARAILEMVPIRQAYKARVRALRAKPAVDRLHEKLPEFLSRPPGLTVEQANAMTAPPNVPNAVPPDIGKAAAMIASALPFLPLNTRQAIDSAGGPRQFIEAFEVTTMMRAMQSFLRPVPDPITVPDAEALATLKVLRARANLSERLDARTAVLAPALEAFNLAEAHDTISSTARQWLSAEKRAKNTLVRINGQISRLVDSCGDVAVQSVTPRMLNAFIDHVTSLPAVQSMPAEMRKASFKEQCTWADENRDVPPMEITTRNNYVATVKALFGWLAEREVITTNPAKNLKLLKDQRPPSQKKRRFTQDELIKVKQTADERWKPGTERHTLFLIAAYTGMRLNEPCGLRRRDIIDQSGSLFFRVAYNDERDLKNVGSERDVPVHSDLLEVVKAHIAKVTDPDGLLFPTFPPSRSERLSEQFRDLIRVHAGIGEDEKVTWHSLRHSWEWRAAHVAKLDEPTRCALIGEKQKGRQGMYDTVPGRAELIAGAEKMRPW